MNKQDLLRQCIAVTRQAGNIVRTNWHKAHNVRHKGNIDLVTETDVTVENFLRDKLRMLLPDAEFVGEESAIAGMELPELCWIVDPVDGTTNFVHQIPIVGVSVALCRDGKPELGVIDAPLLGECYYAARDNGAFCNDSPIHVSSAALPTQCVAATGFPYEWNENLQEIIGHLEAILPAVQGLRRMGAASIDLAYVACGRLDVYYEKGLKPWDMAAGWLIVEEAGGQLSDFAGMPMRFGQPLLASNSLVHAEFVRLLTGLPR